MNTFNIILEIVGTFAFAVSGIKTASSKKFDWFGAYVVGVATAIGGGTIRDIMLDVPIFWMRNPFYLIISAMALIYGIMQHRYKSTSKQRKTILLFDTLGLALFTIVGIQKTEQLGFPFWTAIIMGTITGAAGGVMRDVLVGTVPLIFRKEIYAMACIFGGVIYFVCKEAGLDTMICTSAAGIGVIALRYLAIQFHLALPVLKEDDVAGKGAESR